RIAHDADRRGSDRIEPRPRWARLRSRPRHASARGGRGGMARGDPPKRRLPGEIRRALAANVVGRASGARRAPRSRSELTLDQALALLLARYLRIVAM